MHLPRFGVALGWLLLGALSLHQPQRSAARSTSMRHGGPSMPGPAQGRPESGRLALQAGCVECHPVQAEQWAASGHAVAFTASTVQEALAREPRAFCRGCHAPEADPRRPTPEAAAAIGVGCISCHVVDGEILAGADPVSDAPSPHPVRRDPRFSTAQACAGCHEFGFTDLHARRRPQLMQSTVSEHQASPFADVSCAQCHMPLRDGHRDHGFAASRDPAMIRGSVRVEARRPQPCVVELSLTPVGVGHAFPTGDLMRRVALHVTDGDGWEDTRYLAKHWGAARPLGAVVRVLSSDDRVGPGPEPRVVRFERHASRCDRPVRWSARYQRVQEIPGDNEAAAVLAGEISLDAGTLPPVAKKRP